jgi:hypothetical protein
VSDELSVLNLRDDFAEAGDVPEASRWKLEMPSDLEVLVTLAPARAPDEIFQVRLLWTRYPDCPPSLKFRDPNSGRLDMPQAWPVGRGFRPQNLDACVNWCAEGFVAHPEWKTDARFQWNPSGNPLLWVLRQLQEELDEHYQGRFK